MIIGQALVLGDDVNTDELHPSRFYSLNDERVKEGFLGAIANPETTENTQGDLIVLAGQNFGCGSSRETGARVFQLVGVKAVIAVSFARIFKRNLINLGLPALECPSLAQGPLEQLKNGQAVSLDLPNLTLVLGQHPLTLQQLDPLHEAILTAGGLLNHLGIQQ